MEEGGGEDKREKTEFGTVFDRNVLSSLKNV